MSLVDWNEVIQALATQGSNQSFTESISRRRPDRSLQDADAKASKLRIHLRREDRVTVTNHKTVRMVELQTLAELLNRPFSSRVLG